MLLDPNLHLDLQALRDREAAGDVCGIGIADDSRRFERGERFEAFDTSRMSAASMASESSTATL